MLIGHTTTGITLTTIYNFYLHVDFYGTGGYTNEGGDLIPGGTSSLEETNIGEI